MAFDPSKSFAVLVGINLYSETNSVENLKGPVNDVNNVSAFLRQTLKIPAANIIELKGLGPRKDVTAPDAPTGGNLKQNLKNLEGKPAGSFIFFYYSGHGDWNWVSDPKDPRDKYEVLCTWEDELKDTELGEQLNVLAQKHTVLAVLDCCHSGGADRAFDDDPELKSRWLGLYDKERATKRSQPPNLGANTATAPVSLHKDRKYNLIAAAQPSETAMDVIINKAWCGLLTHYLLESLKELQSNLNLATYALLQQSVEAKVRDFSGTKKKYRQEPLLYGHRDRVVFTADTKTVDTPALLAGVIGAWSRTVKLDRGLTHSVQQWDKFLVYPPGSVNFGVVAANANSLTEIQIEKVDNLESVAISTSTPPMPLSNVNIGSFARLSERANATAINILIPENNADPDLERIRQDTPSLITQHIPMKLQFGPPSENDNFDMVVKLDKNMKFDFQTQAGDSIPNLPSISAKDSNNVQQLMGLLKHWCLFQLAAKASPQNTNRRSFDFEFTKTRDPANPASWRLHFKNKHSDPLHITILNLSPAYGVHVIFPYQEASSKEVNSGQEEPPIIVDPRVPDLLQSKTSQQPAYVMKDILKLFVTTRRANYSQYKLPNLESDPTKLKNEASRGNSRRSFPRIADCMIEELEILTPI